MGGLWHAWAVANVPKTPKAPKRPPAVPPDARWVPADREWEQGTIDAKGHKQGPFTYWRPDGTKCNECVLVDGKPHGPFKRFHENGEVSQDGQFADGVVQGTRRWFACDAPTTERMHEGGVSTAVRRSEMDYVKGRVVGVRHFNADGKRVSPQGTPYPDLPDGVDAAAEYRPDEEQWTLGQANSETAERVGRWRTWSAAGVLLEDAEYADGELHGACREFAGDPNPLLDEKIVTEAGRRDHGLRVGRWEFFDAGDQVRSSVDYGVVTTPLAPPSLLAWSNEARTDWEALGRELLSRNEVRAALVTLGRACGVERSTRPLASVLAAHSRALKSEAAEAFAEQCDGELPALATALVDGCSVPHVLRRIAVVLDQASQSRAALDFVNAALVFSPTSNEFLFTRALVLMSLGLSEQADLDAKDLATESADQSAFVRDYVRFLFPRFGFWPSAEPPKTTYDGLPEAPVKSYDEVVIVAQKYATRLMQLRQALLTRVDGSVPYMLPDLGALLPDGPVALEEGEAELPPDEGEDEPRHVTWDEQLELEGLDLPSLMRLARADWAALTWLLWAIGAQDVVLPEGLVSPAEFPLAAGMSAQRLWRARDQRVFSGRNARAQGIPGFLWEGADVAELNPNLASIAEQQYAEMQALFYWLSREDVRSPWQDDLRGS